MMMLLLLCWWCGGGDGGGWVVGATTARGFRPPGGMSLGGEMMMSRVVVTFVGVVTGSLTGAGTHGISLLCMYNIYIYIYNNRILFQQGYYHISLVPTKKRHSFWFLMKLREEIPNSKFQIRTRTTD